MKLKKVFMVCSILISALSHADPEIQNVFDNIFAHRLWPDSESVSGNGSNLSETKVIRTKLPALLKSLKTKIFLDVSCGDFNWMKEINLDFLDKYIGLDIVKDLIAKNNILYANSKKSFYHCNIINDSLPQADVIFCRDTLVHLSIKDVYKALRNFKKSKSKYILMTTFTQKRCSKDTQNKNIQTGQWRPLNFSLSPFFFPQPLLLINEGCTQLGFDDKCLGLWKLEDIHI